MAILLPPSVIANLLLRALRHPRAGMATALAAGLSLAGCLGDSGTAEIDGGLPDASDSMASGGGSASSSGGERSTGGAATPAETGGTDNGGGSADSGGMSATGGSTGSGGAAVAGGMTESGGELASGGMAATGGDTGTTGGSPAVTGGSEPGTGGNIAGGSEATGGMASTGGQAMPPAPAYGLDTRPSNTSCVLGDKLPTLLSETGCFKPGAVPETGVIPYGVNMPLWSDGASKRRFFALPDGTAITVDPTTGDYSFPVGTVLMKEFSVAGKRAETRFMVQTRADQWTVGSYIWLADQSDAELGSGDITVNGTPWTVPDRSTCNKCHTKAAGDALGIEQVQLDGDFTYPSTGRTAPQLDTLMHIGVLKERVDVPALAAMTSSASVQDRARSYLHANCSGCHQPGATALFDARWTTPFAQQGLCNVAPTKGDLGITDPRYIKPGLPLESMVRVRMNITGNNQRMPFVGSDIVHTEGVALMDAWINGLQACP